MTTEKKEILKLLWNEKIEKLYFNAIEDRYFYYKSGVNLQYTDKLFTKIIKKLFGQRSIHIAEELGMIDWKNIPIDTKVLVSDDGVSYIKRYFYKYSEGEDNFYAFTQGTTSYSATRNNKGEPDVTKWQFCKLFDEKE